MSNELRAKAEMLVEAYEEMERKIPALAGDDDSLAHSIEVCRAYLAEHPVDDDKPVTEVFVAESVDWSGYRHPNLPAVFSPKDMLLIACRGKITRGTFRRLCKELGIATK